MIQSGRSRYRKLSVASYLVIGGAIASLGDCALAQIIPDTTLGNENSTVTSTDALDQIDGGATRGANLFHSFQEFNIGNGRSVLFSNPPGIENILSRVTGANPSNILGTLGVSGGNANLFLINPNGIVFGANASLNIGGSFVASTANAVQFGNIGFFSATEKNIPSPLLSVNPSALLFNQINQNAAIQNNSVAPAGTDPAGFNADGLRVPDGKSLLLVGGNVSMDGGELNANGGRVELGGLAEPGTVALRVDGDNLSLIFPENVARASVSLTNQAGVFVTGAGGGNIAVNARNLEILGGSILSAGIGQGLGTPETVAGDITLNVTGEIKVGGGSRVRNRVRLESQGNAGNITIDATSLLLRDGAQLEADTNGQGNAGNVTVRVKDAVSLAGASYILSRVAAGGVGKGGNIDINAASLSLTDGAQLVTRTADASNTQPAGQGDAGNININVTGAIDIAGKRGTSPSGIFSRVETGTVGNAGNITIDAGSFSLRNGAQLSTLTRGQGNAGNVTVRVKDAVSLAGASYILSRVAAGGVGKGGNIDINAATLSLTDGAQLLTLTSSGFDTQPVGQGDAGNININVTGAIDIAGKRGTSPSGIFSQVGTGAVGNAGNITINAGSFSLRNRAQLSAITYGQGNAGNVTVHAKDAVSLANSQILSLVEAGGVGKGGNIDINAATLSLIDGAQVATSALGVGNAGTIVIDADLIALDAAKSGIFSTLGSTTAPIIKVIFDSFGYPQVIIEPREQTINLNAQGNSGNINITSGLLTINNGARLTASTFGRGNAGSINLNTQNAVFSGTDISGLSSGVFSAVEEKAVGNAGAIKITTNELTLKGGAQLVASSFGEGNAGSVTIEATDKFLVNGANSNGSPTGVFAESRTGRGGDIGLQIKNLLMLRHQGLIFATSGVVGSAGLDGNINIGTKFLVAVPSENSDIIATGFGRSPGSNIQVNAQGIFGTQFRQQLTSESDIVATGQVTLNTPDLDPSRGLVNLPAVPVDTSVAQTCAPGGAQAQNSFIITGRGGLPPNPKEALSSDDVVVNWIPLIPGGENPSSPTVSTKATNATLAPLVEAQGWVMNNKGQVVLITTAPTVTPHSSWLPPNSCGAPQSEARAVD